MVKFGNRGKGIVCIIASAFGFALMALFVRLCDDYGGEKIVIWNGDRYRVVRTWLQGDGIDLTCERATNDRKAVTT